MTDARAGHLDPARRWMHPGGGFSSFPRGALEAGIPARFAAQVALHGGRRAVCGDDGDLTYAALDHAANAVASALIGISDETGERIGLLLDPGAASVAATLGSLKAGKLFVPLDPRWAAPRTAWIARHADLRVILCSPAHATQAASLVGPTGHVVPVDVTRLPSTAPDPGVVVSCDAPASIIYTSGSTGRPKGVLDTHRNLLHEVMRLTNALHVGRDDRQTLLRSSCAGAVSDMFTALLNGAALFPFDLIAQGLSAVAPWLRRHGLTIWRSAPSVFRAVLESLGEGESFPELRIVFLCGEPAHRTDFDGFAACCSENSVFVNCLGATEYATATLFFADAGSRLPRGLLPIGAPVDDMEVFLIDAAGRRIVGGGRGEIAVKSPYLAHGYVGEPEATAAVFRGDPGGADGRTFHSGDWGERLADGTLLCLGRLPERDGAEAAASAEAALARLPAVRQIAVTVRAEARGPTLVAHVVTRSDAVALASLRAALHEALPDLAIPVRFEPLREMPRTASGKVDRAALA